MKTAIQEFIEYLEKDYYINELTNFDKDKIQFLEKEKEQIKTAFESGWNWNFSSEKYYQETYNQKQNIIDIMKADEDDGLYNQNES